MKPLERILEMKKKATGKAVTIPAGPKSPMSPSYNNSPNSKMGSKKSSKKGGSY